MQLNVDIDYSNLNTDDLNKLIVHLIELRSKKIDEMGDAGYGIVEDELCAAIVTRQGNILPWSTQSGIQKCIEESDKVLPAGILAHLKDGCTIAQAYIVPVRLYGITELDAYLPK